MSAASQADIQFRCKWLRPGKPILGNIATVNKMYELFVYKAFFNSTVCGGGGIRALAMISNGSMDQGFLFGFNYPLYSSSKNSKLLMAVLFLMSKFSDVEDLAFSTWYMLRKKGSGVRSKDILQKWRYVELCQ